MSQSTEEEDFLHRKFYEQNGNCKRRSLSKRLSSKSHSKQTQNSIDFSTSTLDEFLSCFLRGPSCKVRANCSCDTKDRLIRKRRNLRVQRTKVSWHRTLFPRFRKRRLRSTLSQSEAGSNKHKQTRFSDNFMPRECIHRFWWSSLNALQSCPKSLRWTNCRIFSL